MRCLSHDYRLRWLPRDYHTTILFTSKKPLPIESQLTKEIRFVTFIDAHDELLCCTDNNKISYIIYILACIYLLIYMCAHQIDNWPLLSTDSHIMILIREPSSHSIEIKSLIRKREIPFRSDSRESPCTGAARRDRKFDAEEGRSASFAHA